MIQNNVLDIAIQVAKRIGQTIPTTIADASDSSAQRILGQINNAIEEIIEAHDWQVLRRVAEFTTDSSDYYDLNTIATGFNSFNSYYLWDNTNQRTSSGSTPDEAQAANIWDLRNIYRQYIIRNNRIYFTPKLTSSENRTFTFEYSTEYGINDGSGTDKQFANADTDIIVFPSKLVIRAAIYLWKAEQGQRYTDEFGQYQKMLNSLKNRDGDKRIVVQGGKSSMPYGNIPDTGVGL